MDHTPPWQIVEATQVTELDAHADAWNTLVQQLPAVWPSQTFGWLRAFYAHKLRSSERMVCLFAYQGATLLGVLPLISGCRIFGLGFSRHHYRAPYYGYHTVRVDGQALPGSEAILEAFVVYLEQTRGAPPLLRLRKAPETSPIRTCCHRPDSRLTLLERLSGEEYRIHIHSAGGYASWFAGLNGKFRRELRRQARRLDERAAVQYRLRDTSCSPADNLKRFMAVENSGWKGQQQTSIEAIAGDPPLYREAAEYFAARDWMEWNFLEADGQIIAGQYAVRLNRTLFLWKVGYREDYANCAPGHLLFDRVVENACRRGDVDTVNFLARRTWLRVWNVTPYPLYSLLVFPRGAPFETLIETVFAKGYGLSQPPQPAVSVSARPHDMSRSVVIWGGDVNLGRRQHYRTAELGVDQVLGNIPALREAHLRVVNLECVVAATGEQGVKGSRKGPYYYRARPEMLQVLTAAQIDIVATANNHSGDYGPAALLEQGRWLDDLGLGHTGSGATMEDALTPVIRRAGDLAVAVFALDATEPRFAATADTPGTAYMDPADTSVWREVLEPRLAAARQQAHVVLVAVHWGRNSVTEPDAQKMAAGRALIDAGADAVLGANAHWLQGIEVYQGRPIIHDAGDLLFDSVRKTLHSGGLFRLNLSASGVERIEFIPIGVGFGFSRQFSGAKARKQVRRFAAQCASLGTELVLTPDNTGELRLHPAPRPLPFVSMETIASPTRYDLSIFSRIPNMDGMIGAVESVPQAARMTPVRLGPLTLLGLRVRPQTITRRRMLWVETFWRTDTPLDEDIRLNIRALPVYPVSMPVWGKAMDHDPCDWMTPTRRWRPGTVYRDFYGLRPPRYSKLVNVELQLAIGIVSEATGDTPEWFGPSLRMAIPDLETIPAFDGPLLYRTVFPSLIHDCRPGQTWTAAQLEAVTGGAWLTPPPKGWFVRSSTFKLRNRSLPLPCLFVAYSSAEWQRHARDSRERSHFDRHADLPRIHHRLAGAVVSRPVENLPPDFPLLKVADPIQAIIDLGLAARQRFNGHVVAVTGTAGKSTTVAMLQTMLGGSERVLATYKNSNSRIGAPALLASLNPQHEAVLVEIAQSALWMKRGPVTRQIRPTIAVITDIGISQGALRVRSIADTIRWKTRVCDGLTDSAVAIIGEHLNGFHDVYDRVAKHARRIIVFGCSTSAELCITDVQADAQGSRITLRTPHEQVCWYVPAPSIGMVRNAVAAAAVVYAMERDLTEATQALSAYTPAEGCLQLRRLCVRNQTIEVLDDSWNATVTSMRNAFEALAQMHPTGDGRRIAVLGRMVHLGDLAQPLHEELADPLLATGVNLVLTHGSEMRFLRAKLPSDLLGPHFETAQKIALYLQEHVFNGDIVLIKGSRRNSDFGEVFKILNNLQNFHDGPVVTQLLNIKGHKHLDFLFSQEVNNYTHSPWHSVKGNLTVELMVDAALRHEFIIKKHPYNYYELISNSKRKNSLIIFRNNSPNNSYASNVITKNRHLLKKMLIMHDIPTPDFRIFSEYNKAFDFFYRIRYSVCIKPLKKKSTGNVTVPFMEDRNTFKTGWLNASTDSNKILIENHIAGDNLRILVLYQKAIGAYLCIPPAIIGNGTDNIHTLISKQKHIRQTNPWLRHWWPNDFQLKERYNYNKKPSSGKSIPLTPVASLTQGANTINITDSIDPSLLLFAEKVAEIFSGLNLVCISLIVNNCLKSNALKSVYVIDVDSEPNLADMAFPTLGKPYTEIADHVLDVAIEKGAFAEEEFLLSPAKTFLPPCGGKAFSLEIPERQLRYQAAHLRNLKIVNYRGTITKISNESNAMLFYKGIPHSTPDISRRATFYDKDWMKNILRNSDISTPDWHTFSNKQKSDAWEYIKKNNQDVVIKPVRGAEGRGISTQISTISQFDAAWDLATRTAFKYGSEHIIVEEHVFGNTYRVLVIGCKVVAAAQIKPPTVIGDGTQTISQLILQTNELRELYIGTAQCPIHISSDHRRRLSNNGYDISYIPQKGQSIILNTIANVGVGGEGSDVTEHIHKGFVEIAVKSSKAVFRPLHAGIDIIANDLTLSPCTQTWTVLEVNTNPGFVDHHFPSYGTPRDVYGTLVDYFFYNSDKKYLKQTKCVRFLISGHVRGVGYRRWLWKQAHLHVLSGWVRNRDDGKVEAVFKGPPNAIDHITALCRIGPKRAKVENLRVAPFTETVAAGFEIIRPS